jgi:hypothetical protein
VEEDIKFAVEETVLEESPLSESPKRSTNDKHNEDDASKTSLFEYLELADFTTLDLQQIYDHPY